MKSIRSTKAATAEAGNQPSVKFRKVRVDWHSIIGWKRAELETPWQSEPADVDRLDDDDGQAGDDSR